MRWPLHLVGVAHRGRRVEVSLDCPPEHELARLLCDLPKIHKRVVWDLVSGFFCELSPSHRHELLAGLHLALGDRPVADVLLGPKRSALMGEEHLHAALPAAPEQDAGTRAPRFVGRHHAPPPPRGSVELSPAAWEQPNRRAPPRQGLGPSSLRYGMSMAGAVRPSPRARRGRRAAAPPPSDSGTASTSCRGAARTSPQPGPVPPPSPPGTARRPRPSRSRWPDPAPRPSRRRGA